MTVFVSGFGSWTPPAHVEANHNHPSGAFVSQAEPSEITRKLQSISMHELLNSIGKWFLMTLTDAKLIVISVTDKAWK
jgi:hypothetical protein